MRRLQSIGIAVAMLCTLLLGVQNSHAASITSLSVYTSNDWGGGGYIYAYLTADEDIQFIDWYAKSDPNDPNSEYEILFTSSPYGGTSVYEYLGTFTGDIKGRKYDIKAVAWFSDLENNTFISDSETDRASVYKPAPSHNNGYGTNTGAYGSAVVWSFYYDGSSVVMSASAYATNPTNNPKAKDPNDNPLSVTVWFRTKRYTGLNGGEIRPEQRDTKPTETVDVGESSEYYTPDGMVVDRWVGTLVEGGGAYYFDAHTHLQVSTTKAGVNKPDYWEADTEVQEFTWKDKP